MITNVPSVPPLISNILGAQAFNKALQVANSTGTNSITAGTQVNRFKVEVAEVRQFQPPYDAYVNGFGDPGAAGEAVGTPPDSNYSSPGENIGPGTLNYTSAYSALGSQNSPSESGPGPGVLNFDSASSPYGALSGAQAALSAQQAVSTFGAPSDFTSGVYSAPAAGATLDGGVGVGPVPATFVPASADPSLNIGSTESLWTTPAVVSAPAYSDQWYVVNEGAGNFGGYISLTGDTAQPPDPQPSGGGSDPPPSGGGGSGGGSAPYPVVLNLDGAGVKITQATSSNKFFDMKGDGYQHLTAWAAPGNAVLFYDPTGQGSLTRANQVVFTDWDPTLTASA
jgi:hypothetical protein